jgi:hypothetical protein
MTAFAEIRVVSLPIRTTMSDVDDMCGYLITKPIGAMVPEAKAVLDAKVLDGRKISAMKSWGLLEENGGRMRITDRGRLVAKNGGARRAVALREAVASNAPYRGAVERAVHRGENTLTATDVAAHWHQHFKAEVSDNEKILNDQAICFFHLAEGADLGRLTIGRRGQPTRFDLDEPNARDFLSVQAADIAGSGNGGLHDDALEKAPLPSEHGDALPATSELRAPGKAPERGNRVFITHGSNRKILGQVKELVAFGKFEPVVAQERETAAKPVPDKVMDEMRTCQAAVIHVGLEGVLYDKDSNEYPQVNGNVLIEIGAAMALYGRNFILLVEEGVKLPSNLQGLYECRYSGDELNMPATMKLLKAFNEFK